jgi:hypothetical protein
MTLERIFDLLANFDYLYLPQTIIESFWHADWEGAYRRAGIAGLCQEALSSLVTTNSYPFYVPMNCGWSGHRIHQLLAKYGVKMWGWTFANGEMFFRVKRKQAAWAQYIMLRENVPVNGPLLGEEATRGRRTSGPAEHEPQPSRAPISNTAKDWQQQFNRILGEIYSALNH